MEGSDRGSRQQDGKDLEALVLKGSWWLAREDGVAEDSR